MGKVLDERMVTISIAVEEWLVFEHKSFDRIETNFSPDCNFLASSISNVMLFYRNLEDIDHAREDCRLMFDEYHDKYVVNQRRILSADISLVEAKGRR